MVSAGLRDSAPTHYHTPCITPRNRVGTIGFDLGDPRAAGECHELGIMARRCRAAFLSISDGTSLSDYGSANRHSTPPPKMWTKIDTASLAQSPERACASGATQPAAYAISAIRSGRQAGVVPGSPAKFLLEALKAPRLKPSESSAVRE